MQPYIATFYTHSGALLSHRNLKRSGIAARMMPVPRKLSSSCGTCVYYEAEDPEEARMDQDLEALYLVTETEKFTCRKLK